MPHSRLICCLYVSNYKMKKAVMDSRMNVVECLFVIYAYQNIDQRTIDAFLRKL